MRASSPAAFYTEGTEAQRHRGTEDTEDTEKKTRRSRTGSCPFDMRLGSWVGSPCFCRACSEGMTVSVHAVGRGGSSAHPLGRHLHVSRALRGGALACRRP